MSAQKAKETAADSKERLLMAAIKIFATHGFEGASTRMVVKEADVNISAIPYYFGSKDGLYEAVMRHIISIAMEAQGDRVEQLREALDSGTLTQAKGKALLHDFMSSFVEFLLGERATLHMAQIMIREQMQPSPIFDILYEDMMKPMHETFTRLIAFLINVDPKSQEGILCAHSVFGQIMIFKTHKEFVLRRTGWKSYGPPEKETIISLILQNTDAIISAHKKKAA